MIAFFILLLIIFVLYCIHIRRCYSFFGCLRINGPRPTFFVGNLPDFARTKRISLSIHHWTREFGRIYGYFEGHTPILVISDPDILEKIFLKNFSKFHTRRQFPLEERSTSRGVHLFSATGDHWRRQRSILNPTFSPLKIRRMMPIINDCVEKFLVNLAASTEKNPSDIDIYKFYKSLMMDLIWRCCFGLETDIQTNPNNPYFLRSQQVFARESSTYLTTLLSIFIPELQDYWIRLHSWINKGKVNLRRWIPLLTKLIDEDPNEWLKENVEQIIAQAMNDSNRIDLLHLMLKTVQSTDENINERQLTLNEVKENMYLFMTAGYETASTALAYVTHVLATHPEEQKKLQDHIDVHLKANPILDYDHLNQMEYLDWFIRETLRLYPITPIVLNRQCAETMEIDGIGSIPQGTKLTLDIYSLHYDQNLWGPVDPKIFYPERFATKRHPLAWLAFGAGPRNCIGMRFAMAEMKIALIHLLQNYTISSSQNQLEFTELVTIAPKQVHIRLEPRHIS